MIPAFIIVKDRLTCVVNMVNYLTEDTGCFPVILDNNSTYKPLLDWYDTNPCIVERLKGNYGNGVLFSKPDAIPNIEKPDFFKKYDISNGFIYTDPDLDLSNVPKDFLIIMQQGLNKHTNFHTIGLSLEINDLPDTPIAKEAKGWEAMNWVLIDERYIKAPVDTTFAYYRIKEGKEQDFAKCLRINRPYTARHLPWYYTKENIPEDELYYLKTVTRDFNHYSIRLKNLYGL